MSRIIVGETEINVEHGGMIELRRRAPRLRYAVVNPDSVDSISNGCRCIDVPIEEEERIIELLHDEEGV